MGVDGGAENANSTFVSPVLLAGDRSLTNIIAHEIVHSWSGNLVTNESFEHFWINEGITRCIEFKIMEKKIIIDNEAKILNIKNENEKFNKIDFNNISKESIQLGARYHALQMSYVFSISFCVCIVFYSYFSKFS